MSMKDSVAGTAKRLVAEIVGDGRLADLGKRQASGAANTPAGFDVADPVSEVETRPLEVAGTGLYAAPGDETRFAGLIGLAALKLWADLPRDAQERLFAAAVDDGVIANDLAEFLHNRHPRTVHPSKPTRFA